MSQQVDLALLKLGGALASAQGALSDMQNQVNILTQLAQANDAAAAALRGQLGIAAVNMRDALIAKLRVMGVQPAWALDRVSSLQLVADANGNYIKDAQGNFQIA